MTNELNFDVREESGVVIVRAIGQINIYNSNLLKSEMKKAIERGPRGCVVDLTDVPMIDSSGVGALVVILTELARTHRKLVLSGANSNVRYVFESGKLMQFFQIFKDSDEAVRSLQ